MEYGADNIKILGGLDAVRKVPSMYIGNTGIEGLHHLVYELVDNGLDEAVEGYCDRITVTLYKDGSASVEDNGRGIPVDRMPGEEDITALEVVLTKLHAGGKFDKDSYKYSAGLHGVGLSVVNALSEYLEVEVRRDGKVYFQRYERGVKKTELKVVGETNRTGTKVRFLPDIEIFDAVELNFETLLHRMRDLSFLNNGIRMKVVGRAPSTGAGVREYRGDRRVRRRISAQTRRSSSPSPFTSQARSRRSIFLRRPFSTTTATPRRRTAS